MSPLVEYLHAVHVIHATGAGTKETSYYTPLENLLNRVGKGLKPAVRAVFQLADTGAGRPDFGLFTADQFERKDGGALKGGQTPSRGVGEVKGPGDDLGALTAGAQVSRYWGRYKQVLVTNLRSFAFVVEDERGQPLVVERYDLAETEGAFWPLAAHAEACSEEDETAAEAFLQRCLRHAAPLDAPKDLAWFLASYGREARARLDRAPLDTLAPLRRALEDTLGVRFAGERGERFFRATVVQTLFYGLFSAWVLWHREDEGRTDAFRWRDAGDYLHVPVLLRLFEDLTRTTTLKTLDLRDLVERATATLNRVRRERFFARFADAEAIQYFYEPFLEAYDPALRKALGVWYTPGEVVRYMVARVDEVLRAELGEPDGLASENVVVLDPACGTGAFLVEVLRRIRETLEARGGGATVGLRLKKAATERLYGFELLTAPFVVAHLQMGLALRGAGAPLAAGERVPVFLTNALTGWLPAKDEGQRRLSPEFEDEVEAARHVKRDERILVVIGNPPYEGHPGLALDEERALVEAYRKPKRPDLLRPEGRGLNDLYVRFYRVAERQIAEKTGRGIVCYVSNNSWLDWPSYPAMRERMLTAFDRVWIDNLNGDSRRTGKLTPEGDPDPSAFSTPRNREGIRVGTAVALLARTADHTEGGQAEARYRDFWGLHKLQALKALADEGTLIGLGMKTPDYELLAPEPALGLPLLPRKAAADYLGWLTLPDLIPAYYPGVFTARDAALVDVDLDRLDARMRRYFDPAVSDAVIAEETPALMASTNRFDAPATRRALLRIGYDAGRIMPYLYRPFDVRWLFWFGETKLLDEKRAEYVPHVSGGNTTLVTSQRYRRGFDPPITSRTVASLHVNETGTSVFPLYLAADVTTGGTVRPNLSGRALAFLKERRASPEDLFYHALAVLHTPTYRAENAGALRQDWPRVPLLPTREALLESAALGKEVAALLDPEAPVAGVTAGTIRPELRAVAAPSRAGGGQLTEADFAVTHRWGYTGHTGQVMPGPGRTVARMRPEGTPAALGAGVLDVYLNEHARWESVPDAVWAYTLGGYPVLKKWLSYRTRDVLGRALRLEEVEAFTAIARRIAALLLLNDALDASYTAARTAAA